MQTTPDVATPAGPAVADDPTARLISALVTYSRLSRTWAEVEGRGMTKIQTAILSELSKRGAARVTSLAERIGVELSVVSRQLNALCAAGAIARVRDPEDGRAWLLTISDHGEELLTELRDRRHAWFARVLSEFDDDQRATAAQVLEAVSSEWESVQRRHS